MSSVRIRSTSVVTLPADAAPVPLSAFDAMFVSLPPLLHVYLFPSPAPATPFTALAESLKSSLAETLHSFHPFAGELTYSPSSDSIAIEFPEDGASVTFVEAETDLDFQRLLEAEELDTGALLQLVPVIQRDALPAPVLAVQFTQLVGGVAVGVASHHAVADGRGLFHFMEAWTAAAAGSWRSKGPSPLPLHDRKLVRFDGDEEFYRAVLRYYGPILPRTVAPRPDSVPAQQPSPVVRQTFMFTAVSVRHLKRVHTIQANGGEPSTFAAIAAHAWVSFARASGFDADDTVFIGFFADCRALMSLPVDGAYTGNWVIFCKVGLKVSELAAPDGLARALLAIGEAVKAVKADPLKGRQECIADNQWDRIFLVSGSPWFPAYQVDLGFGRPARVERACLGGKSEAYLTAGREAGSVQAMVAILADKMPAFRLEFVVDGVDGRP